MSTLSDIATQVETFAKNAVAEGEQELSKIVTGVETVAEEAVEAVEPILETNLSTLVGQFGGIAAQLVLSLAGSAGAGLSGSEKANLGATSLIQAALTQGITLLESDASTLIKNAYVAVDDLLTNALGSTAASAPAAG